MTSAADLWVFPMSPAQEGIWRQERLEPGTPRYNLPVGFDLCGALDVAALRGGFGDIVGRHEMLRTRFSSIDGEPVQVVAETGDFGFSAVDLRPLEESQARRLAHREATAFIRQPFDILRGPLLRVGLWRLGDRNWRMVILLHHLVADGWSLGVLFHELELAYCSRLKGLPADLPPLEIQYADFAEWQGERLAEGEMDAHLAFWKERLAGELPTLELPLDRPRTERPGHRGEYLPLSLPADLFRGAERLGQATGSTPFMTLLTAFVALLRRYTAQKDLIIVSPVAGRDRSELAGLIGHFVNLVVLRLRIDDDPTALELVERVRQEAIEAFAHQELPVERLVRELNNDGRLGHALFQVAFAVQAGELTHGLSLDDLEVHTLPLRRGTAKYDLYLSLAPPQAVKNDLLNFLEYRSDLFDASTIRRMVEHFQILLTAMVEEPTLRISELPILSAGEERQLTEWSGTPTAFPRESSIAEVFEGLAAEHPERVALEISGRALTYGQLNRSAERWAAVLIEHGVAVEVRVALAMERSLDMVVAMLAVLKAGGVYVPLDPTFPIERQHFMMRDARVPVVLAHPMREDLEGPEWTPLSFHARNPPDTTLGSEASPKDGRTVDASGAAYVIYTSGSTGRPKGVVVTHRAVVRLVCGTNYIDLGPGDRVAQASNASFDAATFEIWGALLTGGCLVGVDRETLLSPSALAVHLAAQRVGTLFVTTALVNQLSRSVPGIFGGLRHLLFGGEAVDPHRVRDILETGPPERLLHVYGPTESTTFATWFPVERVAVDAVTVPIGRVLANTELRLLDPHLRPVPAGVPGELCLGGDGLARGYLDRPAATAEAFIPDPSEGSEAGARLYRTGDLARFRADGAVEFGGRIDHQVKMRGFRIELGEIESVLGRHPGVEVAAVNVATLPGGERRLVGYVVPNRSPHPSEVGPLGPSPSDLKEFLGQWLPGYMVPGIFVTLEELPLNVNGKVERRALPAPDPEAARAEQEWEPPEGQGEVALSQLWSEVLGVPRVGRRDNFFDLGGDSILALKIVAQAHQRGWGVSTTEIFAHQTVAELATVARPLTVRDGEQELVVGEVPLTPIQRWFFELDPADLHHFNQTLLLAVEEGTSVTALRRALGSLLHHHDALRLRFEQREGEWKQRLGDEDAATFRWLECDLSDLRGDAQDTALGELATELESSLDLQAGPLVGAALVMTAKDGPAHLLLTVHHLAMDGVSWRILLEDLTAAYGAFRRGAVPHLPPKTTSFRAWAERLKGYARSDALRRELESWIAVERRLHRGRPLPEDPPREGQGRENTVASRRMVTVSLGTEETRDLLEEVPSAYRTRIDEVLLAALALSLGAEVGTLAVDLESHGREELFEGVDLSRTVGWFTVLCPLVLEAGDPQSPGETLKRVKEQVRGLAHRGIGYGLLRYLSDARGARTLGDGPSPEVRFNYLGQLDQTLDAASPFELIWGAPGTMHSPRGRRSHLLEIDAVVFDHRLQIEWRYSQARHRSATIEGWAQAFVTALRALIAHCVSPEAGGFTPVDFPEVDDLSQDELDEILAEL